MMSESMRLVPIGAGIPTAGHQFRRDIGEMPNADDLPEHLQECLRRFWEDMEYRGCGEHHAKSSYMAARKMLRILRDSGKNYEIDEIGRDEILFLRDEAINYLSTATIQWYITMFGTFLQVNGNYIVPKLRLTWPSKAYRPNATWLNEDEVVRLLSTDMTIPERTVVMLGLFMGLRRVEIIRLTVGRDHLGCDGLMVRGKGRNGGKYRPVMYPEGMEEQIERMLRWRRGIIAEAREIDPNVKVPDELFLWTRKGKLYSFSEKGTGFDKAFLIPVREKSGIEYGNHTLRRTFARNLWKRGERLEVIAEILGHESTVTTKIYLGINNEDKRNAMGSVNQYKRY